MFATKRASSDTFFPSSPSSQSPLTNFRKAPKFAPASSLTASRQGETFVPDTVRVLMVVNSVLIFQPFVVRCGGKKRPSRTCRVCDEAVVFSDIVDVRRAAPKFAMAQPLRGCALFRR